LFLECGVFAPLFFLFFVSLRFPPMSTLIRNRIKCHRRVRAGDLVPHEWNFRFHTGVQGAAVVALGLIPGRPPNQHGTTDASYVGGSPSGTNENGRSEDKHVGVPGRGPAEKRRKRLTVWENTIPMTLAMKRRPIGYYASAAE
jgi:hypothetical protein